MKLAAWPITQARADDLRAPETAEEAATTLLYAIADLVMERTDGGNLAPALLDAAVFHDFLLAMDGDYSFSGSPFMGSHRLLPAAARMAARIGATALAQELAAAEAEMRAVDPALLAAFDGEGGDLTGAAHDQLSVLLDQRFIPYFRGQKDPFAKPQGAPAGKTGWLDRILGPKPAEDAPMRDPFAHLMEALLDWVQTALPLEIVPDAATAARRLKETHDWAMAEVPHYALSHSRASIGQAATDRLFALGLWPVGRQAGAAHRNLQVVPYTVGRQDGPRMIAFEFGDGLILADADTLKERERHMFPEPLQRHGQLDMPYLRIADTPRIALDRDRFVTFLPTASRPSFDILTYSDQGATQ